MLTYLLAVTVLVLLVADRFPALSRPRRGSRRTQPVTGAGGQRLRTGDLAPGRRLPTGAIVLDGYTSPTARATNVLAVAGIAAVIALSVWLWPDHPTPTDRALAVATALTGTLVAAIVAGSLLAPEATDRTLTRTLTRALPRTRGTHPDHTPQPTTKTHTNPEATPTQATAPRTDHTPTRT